MLCLVQLSKWRECKAKDAEKLLSQWEKVAKCNFKSKAQVHEICFFLMKWNVICNVEDRFWCVRAFCRASHVRASMHRITSLELLKTLMMCLVQLSKWRECKATDAEKLLSQWEKVAKCNFKSNAQVHERCFFLMKWNVICNAEDRFSCLELFLRAKNTNAVRAKNTMLCLVQLSKWRECKAKDAEKLLSQWEKVAKCNFKCNVKYMKDVSFYEMKCYLQCRRQIFMFRAFLRAKNTNAVRAKNTNAVFSATKQMKRMQGQGCWKASFSVRESC